MRWKPAVVNAIKRLCSRKCSEYFTRDELIKQELEQIVADTNSCGKTPEQTLSRELQELRDSGIIEFVDEHGTYRLMIWV